MAKKLSKLKPQYYESANSKNQFCYNVFWLTNIRKKIMRKIWVFKTEYEKAHAFKAKTPSNIRISTRKLKSHYKLPKKKTQLSKFIK
jgi:hypothetical protein